MNKYGYFSCKSCYYFKQILLTLKTINTLRLFIGKLGQLILHRKGTAVIMMPSEKEFQSSP